MLHQDTGRDQSAASAIQGMPNIPSQPPGARRGRHGCSLTASERTNPDHTWILHFWSQELRQISVLQASRLWYLITAALATIYIRLHGNEISYLLLSLVFVFFVGWLGPHRWKETWSKMVAMIT